MDGFLTLAGDPVDPFDAATKQYVDRLCAVGLPPGGPFLPLAGNSTVSGVVTFNRSGTALIVNNQAQVGQLNVTGTGAGAVSGAGMTNFMASPPPLGSLLQNQVVSSALWVRKNYR